MKRLNLTWMKYIFVFSCLLFIASSDALSKDGPTLVLTANVREIHFPRKISSPSLSPDCTKIIFVDYLPSSQKSIDDLSSKPEEGLLWLIDFADNAKQTQLGERVILSDEPKVTWTPTSAAIAFGSKGDIYIADVLNMADRVIPRPNKERKKTYPGYFADYFHSPSYAPNKETLAIGNVYDVWLYDVKSAQFTHLYSPSKELRPGKEMFWLPSIEWSHNSEFLVVLQHKLIRKLIMPSQNPESFSPFRHDPEGFSQRTRMVYVEGLAVIENKSKKVTPIIGNSENIEYYPVFSPSDDLVAYLSRKDSKSKPSIFVYDMARNKSRKIADCKDECNMLSWSQDGSKLVYASNNYLRIVSAGASSLETEKKIRVQNIPDLSDAYWFPRGDRWYFIKPHKPGTYIMGSLDLNLRKR